MVGFVGYHTTAASAVPAARTVMDPFHVVHLAARLCRERRDQIVRKRLYVGCWLIPGWGSGVSAPEISGTRG